MTDSVWLYALDAVVGTDAPLFKLDVSKISHEDGRSLEPMEIPGTPWNVYFDNQNVQGKLMLTGKFSATDSAWDSTNFTGRPFDFVHQLRSVLHGVDAITGVTRPGSSKYNGFKVVLHEVFNGTDRALDIYSEYSTPIVLLFDRFTYEMEAGAPAVVNYTISFIEAGSVINFGRA